ncbi:fatty acyl-CoA reductase wat-like [Bactrocera tryoni]|uniref:fatty acyl-CoA reductase wat-like n=1 Tax=Bactrocera tryoni TaxID=59916 RepID=UPI001A96A87F|nr:fatty acyl-CoA reductase wat-like [Bactrocera tryoni]
MQSFYENKRVFITGGSGFLGRVIIENLLRKTEIKCIYMLIRAKHGTTSEERIKKILSGPLFDKVREVKPQLHTLITPINGDCAQPNLGISPEDREVLTTNVDIVIHSAATIRFNEPLYNALILNVGAIKSVLALAKEMSQLKSFVHISTAFSNCILPHIEEKFYPEIIGITANKALKMAEYLGPELTNNLAKDLLGSFPNTYTFTKALAEELILSEAGTLPICIFRPAIITSTYAEPTPGWVDNYAGATGALYAIAQGMLRVVYIHSNNPSLLVPVDFCANTILACGYKTAQQEKIEKEKSEPVIYNFVPDERNTILWGTVADAGAFYARKYPFSNTIWYPFILKVQTQRLETILAFLLHTIPGYMQDMLLRLRGEKTRMVLLNQKQEQFLQVLSYFKTNAWTHDTTNTKNLWQSLTPAEQSNFNFNMSGVCWKQYLNDILFGLQRYLVREDDETMLKAKKRLRKLQFIHRSLLALIVTGLTLFVFIVTFYCLEQRYLNTNYFSTIKIFVK